MAMWAMVKIGGGLLGGLQIWDQIFYIIINIVQCYKKTK